MGMSLTAETCGPRVGTRGGSARVLRAVTVGELLWRFLAMPLGCGRAAPAPGLKAPATSERRGPPAAPPALDATGEPGQPTAILFKNVKVFDGKSDKLTASTSVLVVGNKIEKIGGDIAAPEKATVIDGGGRTLMPGLIDAHWHAMLVRPTPAEALTWDVGYANLVAGAEATDTLLRGFTTVRDVGGPAFGLKRAIDEGVVAGPRIYPSGAMITVTSGHGDFRQPFEVPRTLGQRADAHGTDRRQHARRQSGRGPPARARATHAGRDADQADGRRRRGVAPQPARRDHLHRARAACRRRSRRELGHLRHRACLHARLDPAGDRRRREVHRARPPDGRSDRQA